MDKYTTIDLIDILDEHLIENQSIHDLQMARYVKEFLQKLANRKSISVMGYDNKYWAGNSVNTMSEALSEAKRFISQSDVAIKIVDPNNKTIYISSEDIKDEVLRVTKIQYPEIQDWKIETKDFNQK